MVRPLPSFELPRSIAASGFARLARGVLTRHLTVGPRWLLEVPTHGATQGAGDAVFRYGEAHELESVGRLSGESDEDLAYVRARLAVGDRFVVGHVEGELAFYAWLMFGQIEIGSRVARVSPAIAHSYKVFTAPAFRGRGVVGGYYASIRARLAGEGFERVVAAVRRDNHASLRAHHKAGFRRIGALWDARIGPWKHTLLPASTAAIVERKRLAERTLF